MIYLNDDYWNGDDNFNNAPKDDNNGKQNPKSPNDKEPKLGVLKIFLIISSLMLIWTVLEGIVQKASRVPYSEFMTYLKNGKVGSVDINNRSNISYVLKTGEQGTTKIPYDDPTLLGKLNANDVKLSGSDKKISFFELFIAVLPYLFLIYMFSMFYKAQGIGGNIGSFGKSLAREFKPDGKDLIKFSDVAGQKEAKTELEEVVSFLKNPKKFTEIGAKIPKGVLLVGPPGTGKTLIARAVAGEAGVSFLHTSGSDFVEMFVGMGASRVRDLFSEAKKKSPCIIFIDELDAVGRSRGSGLGGGHDEREQTLNQMLVEMDGFETEKGIIVMAATNRADVLDNALLRAGRFDRQVVVDLPDIKEREEILKIHFAKIKADDDINLKTIARATPGCSGADLANLVNEAALLAARFNKVKVTMADLEKARDKILLGIARESKVLTPEEKTATAYHEAGHALLHYYVKGVDPLHKVTIIPHGRALGLTMSLPEKDVTTRNRDNLLGWIKITMGGYVAEDLVYGQTTTGTSNDIQQATNIATKMVTEWGMSPLGFVNYATDEQPLFFGRELASRKNFSESTADKIDLEVRKILDDCLNDVKKILTEHRDQLDKLSRRLVDKETLDDKEIRELLGFEPLEEKPLEG